VEARNRRGRWWSTASAMCSAPLRDGGPTPASTATPPPQRPTYSAPGPEAREAARWASSVCGTRRLSAVGCGEGGSEIVAVCGGDGGGWLFRVYGEIWEAKRKMGLRAL
jgi:hypothetical protein